MPKLVRCANLGAVVMPFVAFLIAVAHVGHGSGLKGLWHAHTGWHMKAQGSAEFRKYAPDLVEDRGMRWISRNFLLFAGLGLLI